MASQSYQLVMQKGPSPGKIFELSASETTIGRESSNHIVINDVEISRKHSRLIAQPDGFVIEDMGSTNGTFVNGQRLVGPHLLRPGETIMLGEKISLSYEAVGYDADATLIGAGGQPRPVDTYRVEPPAQEVYPAGPPPVYAPPPVYQQPVPVQQTYGGQPAPGTAADYTAASYEAPYAYEEEEEKKGLSSRTLLLVGCGCLVIILCCLTVAAFAFDYMNLYCEPPFNMIFNCP